MARSMLSDELWLKLKTIVRQHGIYDKPTHRLMIKAVLYRVRVGCPWKTPPAGFEKLKFNISKF